MDLSEIRKMIDEIDDQLIELICRRMDCSLKVAEYKAANNLPVLSQQRENQILEKVKKRCEQYRAGYGSPASVVFAAVMDASRGLQYSRMDSGAELKAKLLSAKKALIPPNKARVVCQGVPGAYSGEAASALFPGSSPGFVDTFADVFAAVEKGQADYGILPVENSSSGSVHEVYDLIIKHRFYIAAAAEIRVNHCLLAVPGAGISDLSTVYSHPQALAQCAELISSLNLEARSYANTAAAARMVAESGDKTIGAIASAAAAKLYGLTILKQNIQSLENNSTRFISISRDLTIPQDADKISLIFALPHVTGSLYRTLSRFAVTGLNLTKLESRPSRSGSFEYLFYLDFEGSLNSPETLNLICALSEELPAFSFIGNYRELGTV